MNKHILLAMKWLDDKDSVSRKELKENKWEAYAAAADAAYAAADAADAAADAAAYAAAGAAYTAYATAYTAYATAYAHAAHAAYAAYAADAAAADDADADYWVDKYFKESGEDKNEYLKELIR